MPADEVTHGTGVDASRVRTGPRHAAPKKPLFTRFHMPAGKAIALAAMPTAVLMGMGFTPTLANAEDQPSQSELADEYKECVAVLEDDASASASPSPSASASDDASESAEPTPSATATSNSSDSGGSSSSDSGSGDAKPEPTPSASESTSTSSGETATPAPSASESSGNVLETIGDAIEDIFTGGDDSTASASPTPSASASASESADDPSTSTDSSDAVKETTEKVTDTVQDTVEETTDTASEAAADATEAAEDAAADATSSPSPSASPTKDAKDCAVATDEEGGVDNKVDLPDNPWFLNASSLTLKGADYQGIVKVRTASGKIKKVLKFVISDGTVIGDLHQTVKDEQAGKTYHVQAGKGTESTITNGDTLMYTESISGNLFGLIPVTFSPDNPPPLNIPYIYFTNVKVQQAGQFGGTLTVPGLHQYVTD
ncbi:hypothetical protein F7R91_22250 [Streptomyces luteolifulvus]|uniref:Membrane-bound hydrophilic protein n=1 Tax=Streptomyces luteolifulvus TaxID=2615112 RepID=A0A6H9UW54_9ACTN|nr:hypothetical protein [Streptomyces luteolifulvus]KAB1144527.1 hypothetical protein F7R91_22250 [Streptomyces luteolifulvus]